MFCFQPGTHLHVSFEKFSFVAKQIRLQDKTKSELPFINGNMRTNSGFFLLLLPNKGLFVNKAQKCLQFDKQLLLTV